MDELSDSPVRAASWSMETSMVSVRRQSAEAISKGRTSPGTSERIHTQASFLSDSGLTKVRAVHDACGHPERECGGELQQPLHKDPKGSSKCTFVVRSGELGTSGRTYKEMEGWGGKGYKNRKHIKERIDENTNIVRGGRMNRWLSLSYTREMGHKAKR